jgi:hypothetical protein
MKKEREKARFCPKLAQTLSELAPFRTPMGHRPVSEASSLCPLAEAAERGRFDYIFGSEVLVADTGRARRASQKSRTPNPPNGERQWAVRRVSEASSLCPLPKK